MGKFTKNNSTLKSIINFSKGSLFGGIGTFLNNYFSALYLGPTLWGMWQGARLIIDYGTNSHLGVQNAMHREIPILQGRRDIQQIETTINTTFAFSVLVGIIVFIITLFFSIINFYIDKKQYALILLSLAFIVLFQILNSYYNCLLRAKGYFDIVGTSSTLDGLANIISIPLVYIWGLNGLLIGQTFRVVITFLFLLNSTKKHTFIRFKIDIMKLKYLIYIGFPILFLVIADLILKSTDRFIILKFLSTKDLGLFSLGFIIFSPFMMIFNACNSVFYPKIAKAYGENIDIRIILENYIIKPLMILAIPGAIVLAILLFTLPLLVKGFLPTYQQGIVSAQILIIGLFFYGLAGLPGNLFLANGKQMIRVFLLIVAILLNIIFSFLFLKMGYGIEGVALGSALSYLVLFLVIIFLLGKETNSKNNYFINIYFKIFLIPLFILLVGFKTSFVLEVASKVL